MNVIKTMKVINHACENDISIPTSFLRSIGANHGLNRIKIELNEDKTLTLRIYDERAEKRKKWVAKMFAEYCREEHATHAVHGRTTYVAIYEECSGEMYTGFSTAVHSDVYDWETGVAVAYAKAVGNIIPEYI